MTTYLFVQLVEKGGARATTSWCGGVAVGVYFYTYERASFSHKICPYRKELDRLFGIPDDVDPATRDILRQDWVPTRRRMSREDLVVLHRSKNPDAIRRAYDRVEAAGFPPRAGVPQGSGPRWLGYDRLDITWDGQRRGKPALPAELAAAYRSEVNAATAEMPLSRALQDTEDLWETYAAFARQVAIPA